MKKNILKLFALIALIFGTVFCSQQVTVLAKTTNDANVVTLTEEQDPASPDINEDENTDDDIVALREKINNEINVGYPVNSTSEIVDTRLYSALLKIVKDRIFEKYNYNYSDLDTLYSKTFASTELAIESIEIRDWDISSLAGLEILYFTNLKSLTIVGNNLGELKDDLFQRMPALETLNFACNKISKIDFKYAPKLKSVNLSSNNLTAVDLTYFVGTDLDINLANNQFTSIKNISLPTRVDSIKLNIVANNISDLTDEYLSYNKLTLNTGVQGISGTDTKSIDTSTALDFYKINLGGVYIKIFKSGVGDTLVDEIKDVNITDKKLSKKFSVGEYYIEYYNADGTLGYKNNNDETAYFKTYKFKVIPTACTAKFEFKGKIYDNFPNKVTGKVKVILSCEEGGEIYYKFGDNDWTQGNEIMCDKGGNYGITTKVVIDGIESEQKSFLVKTSLNPIIPDILMLVLILIFTLALFLIIVPLVSKKWFRK